MDWSYHTTLLEDWITTFYQQLGILKPNDLCIEKIAQLCNIILLKDDIDSYYIANNYLKMIVIDSRLSKEKQKEVFSMNYAISCATLAYKGLCLMLFANCKNGMRYVLPNMQLSPFIC
ncbi:hypothetical protein [Bacillus paramycoides]|uniref:hypothetical protein n=1 Tax=Bacillus paramycoides TaxID=2026194 RepID=UPI003D25622E